MRPQGTELLTFEGEIAVVIGRAARNVTPEQGLAHVGWYAAANDVGVYDLRWNDRGSNVRSKGHDGYTPVGPRGRGGRRRPGAIALRTLVNGEVVQEDTTARPALPVRPAGRRPLALHDARAGRHHPDRHACRARGPVEPGDVVDGRAAPGSRRCGTRSSRRASRSRRSARSRGSRPRRARPRSASTRRARVTLTPAAEAALRSVSTATLSVQIARRGVRNTFLEGLRPTRPDLRLLGYAHTLRYVPLREDVRDADTAELNAQKSAIEAHRARRGARDRRPRRGRGRDDRRHPRRTRARARRDGHRHRRRRARQPGARRARDPDLLPGAARRRARARPLPARVERARSPAAACS